MNGIVEEMNMKLLFILKSKLNFNELIQYKIFIFIFYLFMTIPFVVLILYVNINYVEQSSYATQIKEVRQSIKKSCELQKKRNIFFKKFGQVDSKYVEHVLGSKVFLKNEVAELQTVSDHPIFETCNWMKQRLNFLVQGDNQLLYVENGNQIKNQINEVYLKQKQPVEIDLDDLRYLLSSIEGVRIGDVQQNGMAPQLIVQKMLLSKKTFLERETLLLEIDLIKREIIK